MKPLVPEHGSFLDALTKGLDEGKKKQWKFRATTLVLTHAVAIPGYGDIFWMGLYDNGSDSPKSSSEFLKKTDDSWYPVAYARMARQGGTRFSSGLSATALFAPAAGAAGSAEPVRASRSCGHGKPERGLHRCSYRAENHDDDLQQERQAVKFCTYERLKGGNRQCRAAFTI